MKELNANDLNQVSGGTIDRNAIQKYYCDNKDCENGKLGWTHSFETELCPECGEIAVPYPMA